MIRTSCGVGTFCAASVSVIRPLLESTNPSVRSYTALALEALAFRSWSRPSGTDRFDTSAFDAWLAQNGSRSRRGWAGDALERPVKKSLGGRRVTAPGQSSPLHVS